MSNSPPLYSDKQIIKIGKNQKSVFCPDKHTSRWNSHPRVYLQLGKSKRASCPYCGTLFIID